MNWQASVMVGLEDSKVFPLSRGAPTELPLPGSISWKCVASPVTTDERGTERVRVDLTCGAHSETFEAEQREPIYIRIPDTEYEPLFTIVVGRLTPTDDDGGKRKTRSTDMQHEEATL
jgi:hypothetical protein